MLILFPRNPVAPDKPDSAFEREWEAAQEIGLQTGLADLDVPDHPSLCKRTVRQTYKGETLVYRGWMLTVTQYVKLYEQLWDLGYRMVNSPQEYAYCHELPNWYPDFEGKTPKSIWFPDAPLDPKEYLTPGSGIMARIRVEVPNQLGPGPYIIKDYVKSRKHEWNEACFIKGPDDLLSVTANFVERQGDDLAGGLVFREYQAFRPVGTHPKSKIPIFNEARYFVGRGPLLCVPYWGPAEGGSAITIPKGAGYEMAAFVKSNFFTVDVAELPDGTWTIVELGDGQVAGLPELCDPEHFYGELGKRFG